MPILLANLPPSRPAAEGMAPATDPARDADFDRHLGAAGRSDGGTTADRREGPAPTREPVAREPVAREPVPHEPGGRATPTASAEPPAPVDAPADRTVAEVLALLMPVALPTPPVVDPLADAPALPLPILPIAAAPSATPVATTTPIAGSAPTLPAASAPAAPFPPLPQPMANSPEPVAMDAFSGDRSITAIDGMATAASVPMTSAPATAASLAEDGIAVPPPASEAPPTEIASAAPVDSVLAMLAAVAAAPEPIAESTAMPPDAATEPMPTVPGEKAAAAPLPSQRPRNQAFERDAAPEAVLPDSDAPPKPAPVSTAAADTSVAIAPAPATTPERQPAPLRSEAATAPKTEADAGRAANAMDRAVAGQVSRAMLSRGASGERMLVLRLTPPELGTVRVEIIERAGVLSARIHAEDDAVRVALERSLPQMRQDLRAHDAPVREVSLADAWNGFANRQGRNDASDGHPRQRREDGAPAFAIDGVSAAAAPSAGHALGGIANALGVDARA